MEGIPEDYLSVSVEVQRDVSGKVTDEDVKPTGALSQNIITVFKV